MLPGLDTHRHGPGSRDHFEQRAVDLLLDSQDQGKANTSGERPVPNRVGESEKRRAIRRRGVQVDNIDAGTISLELLPEHGYHLRLFAVLCRRPRGRFRPLHAPWAPAAIEVSLQEPAACPQSPDVARDRDDLAVEGRLCFVKGGEHAPKGQHPGGFVPVQAPEADEAGARQGAISADDAFAFETVSPRQPQICLAMCLRTGSLR